MSRGECKRVLSALGKREEDGTLKLSVPLMLCLDEEIGSAANKRHIIIVGFFLFLSVYLDTVTIVYL